MTDDDTLTIRTAGRDDVDTIHDMILALARDTDEAGNIRSQPEDFMRHGFGDQALFDALLAERGDRSVGLCLYFYSFSTWLGEPGIYVQDLFVADEERGRGTGERLLSEVAAKGRLREASHMRLSVYAWNHGAMRFYERVGLEHRNQEETFHIGGDAFFALAGSGR